MVKVKNLKTLPRFEKSSPSIDIRWLPEKPQNDKNDEVDQNNDFWKTEMLMIFFNCKFFNIKQIHRLFYIVSTYYECLISYNT